MKSILDKLSEACMTPSNAKDFMIKLSNLIVSVDVMAFNVYLATFLQEKPQ
jgi:hypothetical protein